MTDDVEEGEGIPDVFELVVVIVIAGIFEVVLKMPADIGNHFREALYDMEVIYTDGGMREAFFGKRDKASAHVTYKVEDFITLVAAVLLPEIL